MKPQIFIAFFGLMATAALLQGLGLYSHPILDLILAVGGPITLISFAYELHLLRRTVRTHKNQIGN